MTISQIRVIFSLAWPVLVAQMSGMLLMVIDTFLLGHYSPLALATAAVADGVYVTVLMALSGILQAIAPTVSHLKGGGKSHQIADALQQGFWLALILFIPGMLILNFPGFLLDLFTIDPALESQVRDYLSITALAIPFSLLYRVFYFFCNAIGNPKPLMRISLTVTLLHLPIAAWLIFGGFGLKPLGAIGAAVAIVFNTLFTFSCGLVYLIKSQKLAPLALLKNWRAPRLAMQSELLRLGMPMGLSNFVEISAFTLVALFLTPLGPTVVAAHRIAGNLSALWYMVPLSIAIATLAQVGLYAGAHDWPRVRASIRAGMYLAGGISIVQSVALWLFSAPIAAQFTDEADVYTIAVGLVVYVAAYQAFDAIQTVAGFSLRGMKISFIPMLLHTISFWGVGLGGGYYFAYHLERPMGAAGFWLAAILSVALAMCLLCPLLYFVLRIHEKKHPARALP